MLALLVHGVLVTIGGLVGVVLFVRATIGLAETGFQIFGYAGVVIFAVVTAAGVCGITCAKGLSRRRFPSYVSAMVLESLLALAAAVYSFFAVMALHWLAIVSLLVLASALHTLVLLASAPARACYRRGADGDGRLRQGARR